MTYLLDTNVCIKLLNNSSLAVVNELANLSTVVQLELYHGAYKSSKRDQNLVKLERFLISF